MSLLDEALRKRSQEKGRPGAPPLPFAAGTGRRVHARTRRLLLIAVVLGVTVGAVWLFSPTDEPPISRPMKRPDPVAATMAPPAATPLASLPAAATQPASTAPPATPQASIVAAANPVARRQSINRPGIGNVVPSRADKTGGKAPKIVILPAAAAPPSDAASPAAFSDEELPAAAAPFYEKALSYHREGLRDQAIAMYAEVLKLNPRHFQSRFNLASLYLKAEAFSQAQPLLADLAQLRPNDGRVALNLAVAELGLEQPEKALADLRQAERNGAAPFDVNLHRGAALSQLGRLDEAIASYRRAEALRPEVPELRFNLAVALDKSGQYTEALRHYQGFLTQAPAASPQRQAVIERIAVLRAFLTGQHGPLGNS